MTIDLGIPPITGQLGCSLEGAGKRRIFAIGNYINQRLLKPVHQWFASVLRGIPMDGTFNQTKPFVRLIPSYTCFSYDLKSATDRWPLYYMSEVVTLLFDRSIRAFLGGKGAFHRVILFRRMSRARFRERTFPLLQGRGETFKRRDGDGSAAIEDEGESVGNWS